jgi:isoleucyl-tRNA synthetase
MFPSLAHHPRFPLLEEDTLRFWKTHRIFEKSAELRQGGLPYRVTPQPPAPVHLPELQAVVEFAVQDLYLRYKAMRGYRVAWQLAWNAHSPPVELGAEERLGLAGPSQVAAYGLSRFHDLCRRSAFDYLLDWERLAERIGLWCDWDQAPADLSNEQIEACWRALKTLWERKLLYLDECAAPYCPRCATPVGSPTGRLPERLTEQTEVLLRLPLVEDPGTALLIWTDQPWSLPGNVAVAADPSAEYVIVEHDLPETSGGGTEKLILARQRVAALLGKAPIRIYERFRGTRLKGLRYQPLFTYLLPDKPAYQVVLSEAVTLEPGTGLAQISPQFNEQARQIAQAHNLPQLPSVASDGAFVSEIRPWRGLLLRQAVPRIVQDLQQRGLVFQTQSDVQSLPACPACGSALIDYTSRSWYLGSAPERHHLASLARKVDFHPALPATEQGDMLLAPATNWLVSRRRTWGAPLPIWDCRRCKQQHVVGSLAELAELTNGDVSILDLHLPALDALELTCPDCGEPMLRLPGVLDSWFELGRMGSGHTASPDGMLTPAGEPPDLVCCVVDSAADWLTALHLLSGLLHDQPASRQVLWLPTVRLWEPSNPHDERPTPLSLVREQGADALRWTIYLQLPQEALLVSPEVVSQHGESFLRWLWLLGELLNSRVDLHLLRQPGSEQTIPQSNIAVCLDDWLISRLHSLVRDMTTALEAVDTRLAVLAVREFVQDDLAGWYVPLRLNPRCDPPADSESYRPLFETLVTLSRILAPVVPFLAEGLYQNLVRGLGPQAGESVHLADWPTFDPACIQSDLEADMTVIRRLAALGRAARQQGRLPLHQPLAEAAFALESPQPARLVETYAALLAEDLNVRSIRLLAPAELDEALADERRRWAIASEGGEHAALARRLTPELASEGLAGEFIQSVHELRQKAGLAPQERIRIVYTATARLAEALETHRERICADTQADDLQAFTQASQSRLSEAMKSLFTISEFSGEKVTFGIEKA